jgi:hypothetical protein
MMESDQSSPTGNDPRSVPGWLSSDEPRFRTVYAPGTYPRTTDGPVIWAPVSKEEELIGYVWVGEDADAADFFLRPGHPMDELWLNTRVAWVGRLREARAEGLTPIQAMERWAQEPADATGAVGPRQHAESLQALHALAETS